MGIFKVLFEVVLCMFYNQMSESFTQVINKIISTFNDTEANSNFLSVVVVIVTDGSKASKFFNGLRDNGVSRELSHGLDFCLNIIQGVTINNTMTGEKMCEDVVQGLFNQVADRITECFEVIFLKSSHKMLN